MVKLGILTSSRADFGVYEPLLNELSSRDNIEYSIIAFGTHLSVFHGNTVNEIRANGYKVGYSLQTTLAGDDEIAISTSAALTMMKFSEFWSQNKKQFDFIFCLGDRYEMCSAVLAGVPFGIKFIHLYGGDHSEGAIDDVYRNCLTQASVLHFTSTDICSQRVKELIGKKQNVYTIGILSLNDIPNLPLLSLDDFQQVWNINLSLPTLLITFHPETVHPERNIQYAAVIKKVLMQLSSHFQLVITMPNSDTNGFIFRQMYEEVKRNISGTIHLIENFGRINYFTCMKYCKLMLGNTSSGISEAASFNKYFINIGDRQKGRSLGKNIVSVTFDEYAILKAVDISLGCPSFEGENIYYKKDGIKLLIDELLCYKEKKGMDT